MPAMVIGSAGCGDAATDRQHAGPDPDGSEVVSVGGARVRRRGRHLRGRAAAGRRRGRPPQAGPTAVVRRHRGPAGGRPQTAPTACCRPNEVLVLERGTRPVQAMAREQPGRVRPARRRHRRTDRRPPRRPGVTARYTSFLAMPLIARGVVLGCVTFAGRRAARRSGPADIPRPASWPSRAGVSMDNARLYDRERRTALALQRAAAGQAEDPGGHGGRAPVTCRSARAWWAATGTTSCRCPAAGRR